MSDAIIIILFIFILIGLGLAIFLIIRKSKSTNEPNESMLMLQNQLGQLNQILDNKLSQSAENMRLQFGESAKIIRDVTEKLAKLDETNKQVIGFAEQLQSLENILKNPKQRGILGEYYLKELLENVFAPNQYQLQYGFKDGQIVDAVIFLKDKIIPIDSKFSLENYNRILEENDEVRRAQLEKIFRQDLKNRIDETAKYIRPSENTFEFAFMFIPSEAIYYDLLINKVGAVKINTRNLLEYAFRDKHVIVVSPTSFYAYLQTIIHGLRALQIEESAKEIRQRVEMLSKHLLSYDEYLKKLGNNLSTTVNMYNSAYKEFAKIDKDVVKITEGERQIEAGEVEKPNPTNYE